MPTCTRCGKLNEGGSAFCNSCGAALPTEGGRAGPRPRSKRPGRIIVAAVIAVIAVVSLGFLLLPGVGVTEWEHVNAGVAVVFVMDVQNDNAFLERTATVYCEVHTGSGNTYTSTRNVTLGPGETIARLTMTVAIPLSDMTSEPAVKVFVR